MKKKKTENKIVLSHKVKLPKHLNFYLHNLFEKNKVLVNLQLGKLWSEESFERVNTNSKAWKALEPLFQRPASVPSRVFRNSLELSGRIVRSLRERKQLLELVLSKPCLTLIPEWKVKREFSLPQSPHLILNVKRQVRNLIKEGKKINSFFELERPQFSGNVFLTDADDSIENGQFKKLKVKEDKIELQIKLPEGKGWVWKKVELETPERVKKLLKKGYFLKAPLLKRERTHRGEEYYLVLVFEKELKERKEKTPERVLSIDLCPSMKRLAVGCVVERRGKASRPIYFKAEEPVRKARRMRKEVSSLKSNIDRLYLEMGKTEKEVVREKLREKIDHLFKEKKLKEGKLRNLRKEIVEILTNEIILSAKVSRADAIVIEELSFKEVPEWRDKSLRWLFSTWFYARFRERLKGKAKEGRDRGKGSQPNEHKQGMFLRGGS